jgi:hypothetical protein
MTNKIPVKSKHYHFLLHEETMTIMIYNHRTDEDIGELSVFGKRYHLNIYPKFYLDERSMKEIMSAMDYANKCIKDREYKERKHALV